jgi:hypothetical protein
VQRTAVISPGGLEEVADVDPYRVQWRAWRRPVPARSTAPELLPQCPARVVRAGAATMSLTVAGMAPRRRNALT